MKYEPLLVPTLAFWPCIFLSLVPDETCPGSGTRLCVAPLRYNKDYVFYYINLTRIPVTGVIPLLALLVMNTLVYKRLEKRRKLIFNMRGEYVTCTFVEPKLIYRLLRCQ